VFATALRLAADRPAAGSAQNFTVEGIWEMWSHIPTCGQQLYTEGARGFPTNGQQILSKSAPYIAT